jgi:hypothetical protein
MTAYALAEWRLWKTISLRKTLPVIIVALFAASITPYLQAFLVNAAFCAISLALGWNYGKRFHPGNSFRLLSEGHSEKTVISGRILSSLMIWSLFMLLGAPFLVFVAVAWMLPLSVMAFWIVAWFSAFMLSMGLALLSSMLFGSSDHLLGAYVMGFWLLPGIFLPPARAINPFFQTWSFAQGSGSIPSLIGLACELGLAALAFIASARLLTAQRRRNLA